MVRTLRAVGCNAHVKVAILCVCVFLRTGDDLKTTVGLPIF